MKKLGFIAGFISASMIFGTLGVFAAGGSMIEVFYNVKDVKINKVSKMPEDKPFIYNGTTYVPLRYIAENLGEQVKWEGETQTIHIGEMKEAAAVYPDSGIEHMSYNVMENSGNKFFYGEGPVKDTVGNEYSNSIRLLVREQISKDYSWNEISFPLNGQYKEFKAVAGLTEAYKAAGFSGDLIISLDGEIVLEKEMKSGDFPEDITVDVKNANKITFKLQSNAEANLYDGASADLEVGLFDARFIK